MKLQSNFTTLEQSRRLLKLGVPADSADCYIEDCDVLDTPLVRNNIITNQNDFFDDDAYTPCWSVGRLIEILTITYYKSIDWLSFSNEQPIIETILAELEAGITQSLLDLSKIGGVSMQPFIEGARWADSNPFWKDGKIDHPKDDNEILVRCKVTNGTSNISIKAIGKYQYEEGVGRYRLGKGVLVNPATCVYFYWMPMPNLPWYVNE